MVYVLWILLHGPKRPFLSILVYILHILDYLGQDMQVLYLGRAPRTKETLLDFLKWRRVTRPPLVFRGLTGSQRTPGFWGVTVFFGDSRGFVNLKTSSPELKFFVSTRATCRHQKGDISPKI